MSTAVLDQFRRRFLAIVNKSNGGGSSVSDTEHQSRVAELIQPNDRAIFFRASVEVLETAAQRAGPGAVVINVDDDLDRIAALRKQFEVANDCESRATIHCLCADWSDLRSDLEWAQLQLEQAPVRSLAELIRFKENLTSRASENPIIRDGCVNLAILPMLNKIPAQQVAKFLQEVGRTLERCGRIRLSCLVSDEPLSDCKAVPECFHLPTEMQLMAILEQAGFYGIELMHWDELPQHVIQTAEVRRLDIQAFKGKEGPCYECYQAVVYRGPWQEVRDDDGHLYKRGERTAVCEKTYRLLTSDPYRNHFIPIPPYTTVPVENSLPFDCHGPGIRDPLITKALHPVSPRREVSGCTTDCAC